MFGRLVGWWVISLAAEPPGNKVYISEADLLQQFDAQRQEVTQITLAVSHSRDILTAGQALLALAH